MKNDGLIYSKAMRIQRKKQINKMLRNKLQDSVPVWIRVVRNNRCSPKFLTTLTSFRAMQFTGWGGRVEGKAMSSVLGLESEMFMEHTYSRQ